MNDKVTKLPLLFFVLGTACLVLSVLCTFTPWTRFGWEVYLGHEQNYFDHTYDGSAGRVNLMAGGLLALISIVAMVTRARVLVGLCAVLVLLWTVPFVIWLIVLDVNLGNSRMYGIKLTLLATAATILCHWLGLFLLRRAGA